MNNSEEAQKIKNAKDDRKAALASIAILFLGASIMLLDNHVEKQKREKANQEPIENMRSDSTALTANSRATMAPVLQLR